jgi:plastocyanin
MKNLTRLLLLRHLGPLCVLSCIISWGLCAQLAYKEIVVSEGGIISGAVRFNGTVATIDKMEVTKDSKVCGTLKASPRLEVGKNNGVRNALVYLEGVKEGKTIHQKVKQTLNQKTCSYEPHILLVPPGAQLEIVNSDPILHNVHAYSVGGEIKSLFNIAQPIRGQRTIVPQAQIANAGLVVVTCDAGHPWMSAYILTAKHPYYAVTDEKGSFVLSDVPPGSYKIKMWHEGVHIVRKEMENGKAKKYYFEEPYEILKDVTVLPGGKTAIDFDFSLR